VTEGDKKGETLTRERERDGERREGMVRRERASGENKRESVDSRGKEEERGQGKRLGCRPIKCRPRPREREREIVDIK
jgi:hypothetical protein